MKTITMNEFKSIIADGGWKRWQKVEVTNYFYRKDQHMYVPCVSGWGAKISKLDDVEIIYVEWFSYGQIGQTFVTSPGTWVFDGVGVVNEDGNDIDLPDLADELPIEFSTIDYSELKKLCQFH